MMTWADLELDGAGPEAHPPATAAPPALVIAPARRVVCKVCGRPWVDGDCSFMPDEHRRWGPAWER
jgi:hypothetical protein